MDVKEYKAFRFSDGGFSTVHDLLAVEVALRISINDTPFTVTMRSPGHEKELVRGLLFTEGIYTSTKTEPGFEITVVDDAGHITSVNLSLPVDQVEKAYADTRSMISVSSCGLCGKTELDDLATAQVSAEGSLKPEIIPGFFRAMAAQQETFRSSGGTHAAGAFSKSGELLAVMEDIGRHNAVDKVIGDLLCKGRLNEANCLTVSGRISYEIVSKAATAGIAFLASVSAPSSLAIETAEKAGICLLAFCRNEKFTVYTHPGRIIQKEADVYKS